MRNMSIKEYPDFKMLENILMNNVLKSHPELKEDIDLYNFDIEMFPQTWSSTAGGFEEPGMMSGQAMTTEYTSVIKLTIIRKDRKSFVYYGVFFGNKPAYMVEEPIKGKFFKDLKEHTIKSKYEAKKKY